MNDTVEITIKDNRNEQSHTITLAAPISDAILYYVIQYLNYQGANPMEAAVEFFVKQGSEVATSMIRSQAAAAGEASVSQFMAVVGQSTVPEDPPV